jgi:hypothetical protein
VLAALTGVAVVRDVPNVAEGLTNSPIDPAFASSFVVVPMIPAVLEGVIAPVACNVVNLPVLGVVDPIAPGDAHVKVRSVAAFTLPLHENPELVVQPRAFDAPEQLGTEKADGAPAELLGFPTTVLAAIEESPDRGTTPHPGALEGPVETIV